MKKSLLIILLLFGSAYQVFAQNPGEYVNDVNTVLLLHMNETEGSLVNDASSYGNDGSANNTTIVDGKFGNARSFTGVGDDIGVENNTSLNFGTNAFTIEAWINTGSSSLHNSIISKREGDIGYELNFYDDFPAFIVGDMGSGLIYGQHFINDGVWHHIAGIREGTEIRLYVDGGLESVGSISPSLSVDNNAGIDLVPYNSDEYNYPFLIDEVRISNIARSPEEFNLQLPPKNLTASLIDDDVTLNWENGGGTAPLMTYRIYQGPDSLNLVLIDSTSLTSYSILNMSHGYYYYRVSAVDSTGFESGKSYSASIGLAPSSLVTIDGLKDTFWDTVTGRINIGAPELIWGNVDSPADASGTLYLAYDPDYLYGYFEANDDVIGTKNINWYENDDIDFKLDLNPSSAKISGYPGSWDHPGFWDVLSLQFTAEAGYTGSSSGTPGTFVSRRLTGTGYVIEFAMPFSEIRNDYVNPPETFTPSEGTEIGALVEFIDQDLLTTRDAQLVYGHSSADTYNFWKNVQQLGHFRFLADNQIEVSRENIAAPYPPILLSADTNANEVTLKWLKNTEPDLLRYRIYGGTDPNPVSIMDSSLSDANDTVKVLNGLIPGMVYYFRITAVDSAGRESDFSNEMSTLKTLILYYPFNGNTDDESGHGINGINHGAVPAADRFGNPNSAYSFDGIDNYILGDADLLPTSERTVSLWFYIDDLSIHHSLLCYGGGVCGTSYIMVMNNADGSGTDTYEIQGHCGISRLNVPYPSNPVNFWHHWVVTTSYEGTKFYLDNVLIGSNNIFMNNTSVIEKDLAVGCEINPGGFAPDEWDTNLDFFKGLLDDIRIYNYALNEDEIESLYFENGWVPILLPPKNLICTPASYSVNLSWEFGGGNSPASYYNIYRGSDSTSLNLISSTANTNIVDGFLTPGTYFYRISAVDGTGFETAGSYAAEASVIEGSVFIPTENNLGIITQNGQFSCAWGDYNNDGFLDLFIPANSDILYINENGQQFTDITFESGLSNLSGMAAIWADFDNDGDLDLLRTEWGLRLHRNDNGSFTDISNEAMLDTVALGVWIWQAACGDYDKDGDIDIAFSGGNGSPYPMRVLKNNSGIFEDVTSALLGSTIPLLESWNPCWVDADNDGDLDLWMPTIRSGEQRCVLLLNQGNSLSVADTNVTGIKARSAIVSSWADFDNDGDMDLLVIPYTGDNDGIAKLYQNNGNGVFNEIANSVGLDQPFISARGAYWGDFDNDGDQDLLIGSRDIENQKLFRNDNGSFHEIGLESGAGVCKNPDGFRSVVFVDYDNDGDLDIYYNGMGDKLLLNNKGNAGHWIVIKPKGVSNNSSGIGALITAVTGSLRQTREIQAAAGGITNGNLWAHFGLGSASLVDSLIIKWPSGFTQVLTNLNADLHYTITESVEIPPITITVSNGSGSQALTYGFHSQATDELDASLGEQPLPPFPPIEIFDARLELPVIPVEQSLVDMRNDTVESAEWLIRFQPGESGYPVSFSWDPMNLPAGSFYLTDPITGTLVSVDMKTANNYNLTNPAINSLKIVYLCRVCRNISLSGGWNIFSVPVDAYDMHVENIFMNETSPVYGYGTGYFVEDILEAGKGYWIRNSFEETINVCGSRISLKYIPVNQGWNLIGPYDNNLAVASLTTEPSGILTSPFYGFGTSYYSADTLKEGKGYWIRCSQAGSINIGTAVPKGTPSLLSSVNIKDDWGRIIIRNAKGEERVLYAIKEANEELSMYDLPPRPPAEVFDARFGTERYVELLGLKGKEISFNTGSYPVTIRAEKINIKLKDIADGSIVNKYLKEGEELQITNPAVNKLLVMEEQIPITYQLFQNYPNPFNPKTKIKFGIPEKAVVKLEIYNSLGERVDVLIDKEMDPGYYEAEFGNNSIASGVYFYRIQTQTFSQVKKMMLVK